MELGTRFMIGSLLLAFVYGCSSTGVMSIDRDTFMVAKRTAQVGFGPPVAAVAYVYKTASDFCGGKGKQVETITLEQVDSGFAKPASASLKFRCIAEASTR